MERFFTWEFQGDIYPTYICGGLIIKPFCLFTVQYAAPGLTLMCAIAAAIDLLTGQPWEAL